MWRIIVFVISGILQIVLFFLMIKETRKLRERQKTSEFLIDELKHRENFDVHSLCESYECKESEAESLDNQRAVEDTEYCERHEPTYNPDDGSM